MTISLALTALGVSRRVAEPHSQPSQRRSHEPDNVQNFATCAQSPYSIVIRRILRPARIKKHFLPQRRLNAPETARQSAELEKLSQIAVRVIVCVVARGNVPQVEDFFDEL